MLRFMFGGLGHTCVDNEEELEAEVWGGGGGGGGGGQRGEKFPMVGQNSHCLIRNQEYFTTSEERNYTLCSKQTINQQTSTKTMNEHNLTWHGRCDTVATHLSKIECDWW